MSEEQGFNKKRTRVLKTLGISAGVALLVAATCLAGLMLAGPMVGNSFSTINDELSSVSGGDTYATRSAQLAPVQVTQHVIIRDGYISMSVKDTSDSSQAIEGIVQELAAEGAFIVSSQEFGRADSPMPAINMTIRVPAERFDEVMDRLAGLAERVLERRESAEDVTEEYVDVQARLEAMQAARERLMKLMEQAASVEELLQAENQLTQREVEIESLQGRLDYLTQSAKMSKIQINLQPSTLSQPLGIQWRPGETAQRAWRGLVKSAQGAVNLLIYFGIVILPWLLVLGALVFGVRRIIRRHREGRARQS
ncbi:MAG: DUF4349 domain-containing protein [Anaerolineales bacterium]|nr:DUF4349 domain-containing protein [Anaerolineales bacterium]